jgi:photosystem II stability/assembly factor-like uncharacterized protein
MTFRVCLLLFAASVNPLALAQPSPMRPGAPLPSFSGDASLHGVFFLNADLGWACGDRGTILVTVNGGGSWDVVPTGHEGTLRFIYFKNPKEGIALGGASVGLAGISQALILETIDGGRRWKRIATELPAIHAAGWMDDQTLWATGDRTEQIPSGCFRSNDGGVNWTAMPGATPAPWLCAAFATPHEGILGGYEGIVARSSGRGFLPIDLGLEKPVALRAGTVLEHGQVVLAGERGHVFRFRPATPAQRLVVDGENSAPIDFNSAAAIGNKIWLAGAPGTAVFYSADAGETWTSASTGQAAPIRAIHFHDPDRGFAVGDLGLILATRDGGQTWRIQRRGGQHAAYLAVFADTRQAPWELIARLSGQEGHYGHLICVASHATSTEPTSVAAADMIHRAAARLGASGATVLPGYAVTAEFPIESISKVERRWADGGRSARERLEGDLVRQIQTWRPEVIFTDMPPSNDGDPASQLTSQALLSAVAAAARSGGQSDPLLSPWQVKRVYAVQAGRRGFKTVESGQLATRLGRSLQEAAWPARRECKAVSSLAPELFGLQLLLDHTDNDPARSDLFSGIRIETGGARRRMLSEPTGTGIEAIANRAKRHHEVIKLLQEAQDILKPNEIESRRILQALAGLDVDFSAQALFEFGQIAARRGARDQALAAWNDIKQDLPDHPLAGEARRQVFALSNSAEHLWKDKQTPTPSYAADAPEDPDHSATLSQPDVRANSPGETQTVSASGKDAASQEILALLRPLAEGSYQSQFIAAALQRNSSDPTLAYDFYRAFAKDHSDDLLAPCAESELWLLSRRNRPPKSTHSLRNFDERPFLDGKLEEPHWRGGAISLTTEGGKRSGATCWIARDKDYLYFAARCPSRSEEKPANSTRRRDEEDPRDDRIDLLLDIDRDWSTYFRLSVCRDGTTLDHCAGDATWNPKWFAAVHREQGAWTAECAIPLAELGPYPPEQGDAWGLGLQRTAPDRPLESWTFPASKRIIMTGLGLLLFE